MAAARDIQAPVWQRILILLSKYNPDNVGYYDTQADTTQQGIADALGISRAHATLELNRMKDKGLVESRRGYGPHRSVLTYYATPAGRATLSGERRRDERALRARGVYVDPDDTITLRVLLEAAEKRQKAMKNLAAYAAIGGSLLTLGIILTQGSINETQSR